MSELFGVYLLHVKSHAQKVNFSRSMNFEQHPYWGVNITFVCKRFFSWKLEYIFGEIKLFLWVMKWRLVARV